MEGEGSCLEGAGAGGEGAGRELKPEWGACGELKGRGPGREKRGAEGNVREREGSWKVKGGELEVR